MNNLLGELKKFGRSFPTGLSGETGSGYILTGGISPLSRSKGLAIDNILEFKGIWGNGEHFEISAPDSSTSIENQLKWKGLCGAAPYLAIVTSIKVKTQKRNKLLIWQKFVTPKELALLIELSEQWPDYSSFHWIWADKIKAYGIIEINGRSEIKVLEELNKVFRKDDAPEIINASCLLELPNIKIPITNIENKYRLHSEVIGLLGPGLGSKSYELTNKINELIKKRPNPNCYIAAQQLGGKTSLISSKATSFIHRDSIWKPWISGAWPASDQTAKRRSLYWAEEAWSTLEEYCPGIHLAQMHNHLPWHQKEINGALGEWLPGLRELKSKLDPFSVLPPL